MYGRDARNAFPKELGHDAQPDPADAPDPVPEDLRHEVERVDDHDGPPFDRCAECGEAGPIGDVNPFDRCPAKQAPTPVEERAERADADDEQEALA